MTNWPTSISSFATLVNGVDYVLAQHQNTRSDEIVAIETFLTKLSLSTHFKNAETLAGTKTLTDNDYLVQALNCNGSNRDVKVPPNASTNHAFYIVNTSSGSEVLTVKSNDGTVSHASLTPGKAAFGVPYGSGYLVSIFQQIASSSGGGTPTVTSASITTADLTPTLVTGGVAIYKLDVSGLTANRNFLLPTGAVGDRVKLILGTGDDTYALIIKGAATVTINGGAAATEWSRVRIKNEVVELVLTSTTNWQVEMDGRIPSVGAMSDTNAQNVANTTFTKVTFDTSNANVGNVVDLANDKLVIWRAGVYKISAQVYYYNFAAGSLQCTTYKNGSATGMPNSEDSTLGMGTSSYGNPKLYSYVTLASGDYIELYGRQNSGSAQNPGMKPSAPCLLTVEEVLS